jgi:two-component sensor histidine kinase
MTHGLMVPHPGPIAMARILGIDAGSAMIGGVLIGLIPVSLTISPIRDAYGRVIGASKVSRDISERRAAEAQQRMLTAELDHRVKNMLALVISIAQQTGDHSASLADFSNAFEQRIIGLSQVHSLLSRSRWRGNLLSEIVHRVVAPMCVDPTRCQLGGEDVLLPPNEAIGVAMVLQELTTNAIKHGALRNALGNLELRWNRLDDPEGDALEMLWRESASVPVVPSLRKGYGSQLLRLIIEGDLRGEFSHTVHPQGLECRMRFPLQSPALAGATGGAP